MKAAVSKYNTMKNTMKDLTEAMQRLCAVANRIVAQDGRASRIEIDLLLEDLRGLYDIALRLNGDALPEVPADRHADEAPVKDEAQMMAMMSTMAAMTVEEEKTKEAEKEEVVVTEAPVVEPEPKPVVEAVPHPTSMEPLPKLEELEDNGNELLFDEIIVEPEPPVEPTGMEAPEQPMEPVVPETSEPTEEPEKPKKVEAAVGQASLLDYLSQPAGRTLGETLGADRPQPTSLERKVDDLRTVININDKFSFMSELFHNNMKAYNDFIMRLNAMKLRDEALAHVREVAAQYKWDEGSPAVQSFYKIFDKKF